MEQEEYMKEGIDWTEIKFVDNKLLLVCIQALTNLVVILLSQSLSVSPSLSPSSSRLSRSLSFHFFWL